MARGQARRVEKQAVPCDLKEGKRFDQQQHDDFRVEIEDLAC